ncbi:MAG: protein kinase [Synergistaceae bacterium]|nr:protein kinase [Synergistaceae bacterium]
MSDIKDYEPIWGAWYVDNLIGGGSFGKVYKVHKEEFGKRYEAAVKMISIPQSDEEVRQAQNDGLDPESVRSYFQVSVTDIMQEIDLMNTFRGTSNIVSLEDHKVIERQNEIGWDILIRMELLTTLSSYVTERPLSQSDVVKLGVHICRALELCAAHKAIHRDIKPENIFVSQHGDFKLGDFGIARQIERTMSGLSKKGTENYMAPEVFKGAEYGASVDIYSLGIVMYKFLNKNRRPFLPDFPNPITPRDRDNALQRRMSGEPLPAIPDIDPELNNIVLKACAYDRHERFKSASEMRIALESLKNFNIDFSALNLDLNLNLNKEPEVQQEIKSKPQAKWDDDLDAEQEKTRAVFQPRKEMPKAEIINNNISEPEVPEHIMKNLSLFSMTCMLILGALCFVTQNLINIPVYALCALQCALKFKFKSINIMTLTGLICYIIYAALINFTAFDYAFLAIALSFASIDAARSKKFIFQVILSLFMLGYAVGVSLMIIHAMRGVISQTHYAYVAGAVGMPVMLLLAAPAGIMLAHDKWDHRALSALIALICFSLIAFILSFINPNDKILFYAANSNLIKFMNSVPVFARALVLIWQAIAFIAMLFLAIAQGLPSLYLSFKFKKFLIPFSITAIILAIGLFAASRLLIALI